MNKQPRFHHFLFFIPALFVVITSYLIEDMPVITRIIRRILSDLVRASRDTLDIVLLVVRDYANGNERKNEADAQRAKNDGGGIKGHCFDSVLPNVV